MHLVGLECVVRRAEQAHAVRRLVALVNPPHGAAHVGVVAHGDAESARVGLVAVLVVGQIVVGAQVGELAEVVNTLHDAADRGRSMVCLQVAAVERERRFWDARLTAARRDADHAGEGICARDDAVRFAKDLDPLDTGRRERRKIDAASDVVGGNPVDEHLAEIGVAAPDEDRRGATPCAGLHEGAAGYQPQRLEHVGLPDGVQRLCVEHRDHGSDLRREDFVRRRGDRHLRL